MIRRPHLAKTFALALFALVLISCGSTNPNTDRVLISIAVTPETADAQNSANGQVTFTATGNFSLPPLVAPVPLTPPYDGTFELSGSNVATTVATGTGTLTVQCVPGASGTVLVTATGNANNGLSVIVSANGVLTCP
jgi:hypothetical protein